MTDCTLSDSRSPAARKDDIALQGAIRPTEPVVPTFAIGVLTPCRSCHWRDFWVYFGKIAKCRNGSRLAHQRLHIDVGSLKRISKNVGVPTCVVS